MVGPSVIAVIPLLLTRRLRECVGADLICGLGTHALMNPRPSDPRDNSPPAGVLPGQMMSMMTRDELEM